MMIDNELVQKARRTNLIDYCEQNGYELRQEGYGNYRVVGYKGLIVKDNIYYRHSTNERGSAIDFCSEILGMHFIDAVESLLEVDSVVEDVEGAFLRKAQAKQEKKGVFVLPQKVENTSLFPYLCKVRGIPRKIVREMIEKGNLYQDSNKNCVFPCYDSLRNPKGAIIRGTSKESIFKGRASGSDISFGWVIEPANYCNKVIVVEAPIDAISLLALYPDNAKNNYILALGGLHDDTVKKFLQENRQISEVILALDNDSPAKDFTKKVKSEIEDIYAVEEFLPKGVKDWNEKLLKRKKVG